LRVSDIRTGSVFIDTNILIYAFTNTRFTSVCEELLDKAQQGVVAGFLNSTVIDEFFHKVLIMEVYAERGLQPAESVAFLKQNPDILADFTLPFSITQEVLHDYNLTVLDTAPVLDEALSFSRRYGLLFSDALHAASCSHYAINHLVTNDRDFSRLDQLSVVAP
jgi:uncharacterized protein